MPNAWIEHYKTWLRSDEGRAEIQRCRDEAKREGRPFRITSVVPKCRESYKPVVLGASAASVSSSDVSAVSQG